MKRPPETPIPRHPDSPRRKRDLTEEERALWESVARQAKPLRKKPRVKSDAAAHDALVTKPAVSARPPAPTRIQPTPRLEPPPLAPIGRRERAHLSRGRKEIDARIDLHGMTQVRAHRALSGF